MPSIAPGRWSAAAVLAPSAALVLPSAATAIEPDPDGLSDDRETAARQMQQINPEIDLLSEMPPVDPAQTVAAPSAEDLSGEPEASFSAAAASPCSGQNTWQGSQSSTLIFPFRAATLATIRCTCTGQIAYSCRARVQYRFPDESNYVTASTEPIRAQALGRRCSSTANSPRLGLSEDRWRMYNTYKLVLLDGRRWRNPNEACNIGVGTTVLRCAVVRTFRNGQSGTIGLF